MPTLRNWKDFITNPLFIIPAIADFKVFEQASRLFATRIFIHITYITNCIIVWYCSVFLACLLLYFHSYERETNVIRVWKERRRYIFNDRAEIDNRQWVRERLCNPHLFDLQFEKRCDSLFEKLLKVALKRNKKYLSSETALFNAWNIFCCWDNWNNAATTERVIFPNRMDDVMFAILD